MKKFQYNKLLIVIIIIGLIASLAIDFQRHQVETHNTSVELAIDYEGLVELAEREGIPPEEVFAKAKEAGITSMAVYETTFKKLNENGKASAVNGSTILANYQTGALTDPGWRTLVEDGTIKGTNVYVTGHHMQTFKEVHEDLIRRLGSDRVRELTVSGKPVLEVKANYDALIKMNIGMPTDEMKIVNDAGFYVVARPSNYEKCNDDDVHAMFSRLDGVNVSDVVFSGRQATGAPDAMQATIDEMLKRKLTLGMIEGVTQLQFFPQDGLLQLAKSIDYNAARVYSIDKAEINKMKPQQAVDRWVMTDEERNIRFNLLRIFEEPLPGKSLLETNMQYFADTKAALEAKGFTIGKASTFEHFYPSNLLRSLVMLGTAAAVVLYLCLVIPGLKKKYIYGLFIVFAIGAAAPVLMGHGNKIRILAALAAANVFPAIAVIFQLDRIKGMVRKEIRLPRMIVIGAIALWVTGIMSYVGAAYLSGALADTEYLLEVNIFRGIKLTFVLPLLLVAIAFLQRFDVFDGKMDNTSGVKEQLKLLLDVPVKVKTLIGLFIVLIAGIVFVARSGHTSGMPVAGAELKFRAFLEHAMYARPRSKELLIGHPAFMLAVMAWFRKWPTMVLFVLVIVATIGQGSMVETFAHMRTPIFMSFMRGIGGIVLGAGIGAVAMVLVYLWQHLLVKVEEKKPTNE